MTQLRNKGMFQCRLGVVKIHQARTIMTSQINRFISNFWTEITRLSIVTVKPNIICIIIPIQSNSILLQPQTLMDNRTFLVLKVGHQLQLHLNRCRICRIVFNLTSLYLKMPKLLVETRQIRSNTWDHLLLIKDQRECQEKIL